MRKVKTDRSLLMYILLTIVTCGIYSLIFMHELAEDVNEMCRDDGKNTQGLLMLILLSFVTCGIYPIIWWYSVCDRIGSAANRRFGKTDFNGGTYLLWVLLGMFVCVILSYVGMYKMFECSNMVANHYNQSIDNAYVYGGQPGYGQPQQPYGYQQPYGQQYGQQHGNQYGQQYGNQYGNQYNNNNNNNPFGG